jgi:hypothetical protein
MPVTNFNIKELLSMTNTTIRPGITALALCLLLAACASSGNRTPTAATNKTPVPEKPAGDIMLSVPYKTESNCNGSGACHHTR